MAKHKVQKSGKRSDGTFWIMLQKEVDGFFMQAFIKTAKELKAETEVELPDNKIPWSY